MCLKWILSGKLLRQILESEVRIQRGSETEARTEEQLRALAVMHRGI